MIPPHSLEHTAGMIVLCGSDKVTSGPESRHDTHHTHLASDYTLTQIPRNRLYLQIDMAQCPFTKERKLKDSKLVLVCLLMFHWLVLMMTNDQSLKFLHVLFYVYV